MENSNNQQEIKSTSDYCTQATMLQNILNIDGHKLSNSSKSTMEIIIQRYHFSDFEVEHRKELEKVIEQRKQLSEALEKMCKFHEDNASWDKGDNGYYAAKQVLRKVKEIDKEGIISMQQRLYKNKKLFDQLLNMSEDKGVEGCTWGDTEYDSISASAGYNQALQNVKETIEKQLYFNNGKTNN